MAAREVAKRAVAQIDFFYDVASPYSWLAFETLMRYNSLGLWKAEIRLRPFHLGGVMKATGNMPPGTVQAKMKYMRGDLIRMSKHHGVPFVPLKDVRAIFGTLHAQRLLSAAAMDAPNELEGLTRALWMRVWGGGGEIASEEGLLDACTGAGLGESLSHSLLSRSRDEEVKARLKEETDEALRRGAFGAPWITMRTSEDEPWEAFFGCDRFDVLAKAMGKPWLGPQPDTSAL